MLVKTLTNVSLNFFSLSKTSSAAPAVFTIAQQRLYLCNAIAIKMLHVGTFTVL